MTGGVGMWDLSREDYWEGIRQHDQYHVVVILVVSIVLSLVAAKEAWRVTRPGRDEIPGHVGLPYLGESLPFLSATNSDKGCYDFVRLRRLWHGKMFKTRLFGRIHVFVPSREGAKLVLSNDFVRFNKGYVKSIADAVGCKSLLCAPHEDHKRIRRLLSDPFSMNAMSTFVKKLDQRVLERFQQFEERKESFAVLDFSMKVMFDAMCDMLMSITDADLLSEIAGKCNDVSNMMLSFPAMIPGTRYYKGIKARRELMGIFSGIVSRRRKGLESRDDFLQAMLQRDSSQDDEKKLDDMEIFDNLLTLIIAGQSTTAAALMWSVMFLNGNKEAQEKLREEQVSIASSKPEGSHQLTLEDLKAMSYGSKVVKETLRMSNVLLWFPRVAESDCIIEGMGHSENLSSSCDEALLIIRMCVYNNRCFKIKKGWHVNVDATHIHTDPDLYKDPMEFNPSRFDEIQEPYSFLPFGSGARTCLGINMAKVTMLVFLHRLTSAYRWRVEDLNPSLERKSHIPKLRSGCPITLMPLEKV